MCGGVWIQYQVHVLLYTTYMLGAQLCPVVVHSITHAVMFQDTARTDPPRYGPPKRWVRNDPQGYWDCNTLDIRPRATPQRPPPNPAVPTPPLATSDSPRSPSVGAAIEAALQQSLVWVDVDIPIVALLDGVHSRYDDELWLPGWLLAV